MWNMWIIQLRDYFWITFKAMSVQCAYSIGTFHQFSLRSRLAIRINANESYSELPFLGWHNAATQHIIELVDVLMQSIRSWGWINKTTRAPEKNARKHHSRENRLQKITFSFDDGMPVLVWVTVTATTTHFNSDRKCPESFIHANTVSILFSVWNIWRVPV